MVKKQCDEQIANIKGPGKEQSVESGLLKDDILNQSSTQVDGEVVQSAEEKMESPRDWHGVVNLQGNLKTLEEEREIKIRGERQIQPL